jgi:hypothetical protein
MTAAAGPWRSFGAAARLIVGWFAILIGLLNLLAEADRRTDADVPVLVFQSMLVVGGILLLALGRLAPDPGPAGYAVGAAVATIGLVGSAVPVITSVCCMSAFGVRHGFPFTFLARDGDAGPWHADGHRLVADLLFWGFVGLLALVAVALFRRIASPTVRARTGPPLPAGGTVGGLP